MRHSQRLHYRITNGRLTPFVGLLIVLLCWVVTGFLLPDTTGSGAALWVNRSIGFLLCILTGHLLVTVNNTFAIIRVRSALQAVVYALLVAATPALQGVTAGSITVLLQLVTFGFLFSAYQHPVPAPKLFYAFLALSLGSLIHPQLLFLLPFYWIAAHSFQALTLRSFCGSLVGLALPYWFLWAHAYYHGEMELFYRPFIELATFDPLPPNEYHPWLLAVLGYAGMLYLICGIHYLITSHEDKLRTRGFIQFFLWHTFILLFYIGLQPTQGAAFLPVLYIGISLLTTHYFVLSNSRSTNLLFIFATALWLLLYTYNIWTAL